MKVVINDKEKRDIKVFADYDMPSMKDITPPVKWSLNATVPMIMLYPYISLCREVGKSFLPWKKVKTEFMKVSLK